MAEGKVVRLKNVRIVRGGELSKDELWIQDGRIINPQKYFFDVKKRADEEIDCQGFIIAPGLIDIQFNGAYGIDIASKPDNAAKDADYLSKRLLENGITGFCLTIVSTDNYKKIVSEVRPRKGGTIGAEIIGLHLEGPFISKDKKGCHIESHIKEVVSKEDLLNCYGRNLSGVKIITLAPELPEAMDTIEWLSEEHKEIVISIGHSCANYKQAEEAMDKGVTLITHLFNAMLPFHHRDPGIVGLITRHTDKDSEDQQGSKDQQDQQGSKDQQDSQDSVKPIYYGLIADGHHTLRNAIRIAYRSNKKGIVLVSDAAVVAGLEDGFYEIGELPVEVKDGICVKRNTNILAGSMAMMDKCVRGLKEATGCTIVDALEAASLHPAKLLGIHDQKGSLDFGKDADFIFLNDELEVQATYIAGEKVWSHETFNIQ
ncbi:N-acetylglucosamine-6-phosphate deacetylase-like [Dysidea avara]|uniref:N-acetylglucosamine-6-phosphate deacetylase-like n=1 Tax=Dysidea avara TaxID=196820 RepID=UPI003334058F